MQAALVPGFRGAGTSVNADEAPIGSNGLAIKNDMAKPGRVDDVAVHDEPEERPE